MADGGSITSRCKPVRPAEKRRLATCHFADRVAKVSVDQYHRLPAEDRPEKTCVATIVAHCDGDLRVLSMGIGTKFVPEICLREEADSESYGLRVRDSHAEVLARRALRRYLTVEILRDRQSQDTGTQSILCRSSESSPDNDRKYKLKPGVTLHMYTSSAPCGNATLKKFAKMTREKFTEMDADEWPESKHEPINGQAIREGQFALLVKKDPFAPVIAKEPEKDEAKQVKPKKVWPASVSDDWTPPGTTIVKLGKGSIHCCSDKICLWNCLGLQGSLLASLLETPLYINTLTVGRKLTQSICRRAVCCRLNSLPQLPQGNSESGYHINHPSIMGTAVYLDEAGFIEVDNENRGQDVRFHSSKCWAWWPTISGEENGTADDFGTTFECIDGATGFLFTEEEESDEAEPMISRLSTSSLVSLFLDAYRTIHGDDAPKKEKKSLKLDDLLSLKRELSPNHEAVKEQILTKHRILRQWKRRGR